LFFFCFGELFAQMDTSNIQYYTIHDGLSQSVVNCLMQDKDGFLWIGTQDGLNIYDGYHFRNYRHKPSNNNSLPSNFVSALAQDSKQNIWIATQSGLSKLNLKNLQFTNYQNNVNDAKSLHNNNVLYVYIDKEQNIWLRTPDGLENFDPKTEEFTHYDMKDVMFTEQNTTRNFSIVEDKSDNLWVITNSGLSSFDRKHFQFKYYDEIKSLTSNDLRALYVDTANTLWVGTTNGLYRYSGDNKQPTLFPNKSSDKPFRNVINSMWVDKKRTMWVGTDDGLYTFNRETGAFSFFTATYGGKNMKLKTINAIMQDYSELIWVGSCGVYKIDTKHCKFIKYVRTETNNLDFKGNNVRGIYVDDDDNIWFGTKEGGLHIYNRKDNTVIHYNNSETRNYLPDNQIQVITKTSKGELLLGTGNGVFIYNPVNKQFSNYFKNVAEITCFANNRVNFIFEDHNKNLWFGTNNKGLYLYDYKKLTSFTYDPYDINSLASDEVYSIVQDRDGVIWVGTMQGLNKLTDLNNKKFTRYQTKPNQKSLSNNSVLSLYEAKNGVLWIGTESGLNYYDKKTNSFKYYSQVNGFANDYFYGILEDNDGNLWLSTNHGLAKFDPAKVQITMFHVLEGLQSYEYNLGSYHKSKRGELFFGGVEGFNSFYPKWVKKNTYAPKLKITSIRFIDGKTGKEDTIAVNNNTNYVFSYLDRMFVFEFAAIEYTLPELNSYEYKLMPFNDKWIKNGNNNYASFPEISPGTYQFQLNGFNSDGIQSTDIASINIVITPPIYNNKYAYFLYALLGIFLLYLFYLYFTRNLRKTNQILQEQQKSSIEISKQKEELSIKNKNITDSINYAHRIITAMMPTKKYLSRLLPQSFVLFKPKDIVSGDFYWLGERNNKIFIAAVDCTGHGIPGAFMSIIGYDLLRNIIRIENIEEPAEILNRLSRGVAETFGAAEDINVRDGMDISFCVIDKTTRTLQFSGAVNSMYLIRDNKIIEIKGDRFSVGLAAADYHFTTHEIPMEDNDVVYLFSDGYVDQFGGTDAKKFKFRRFRHLILTIHKLPFAVQRDILEKSIMSWMGNLEQVDDILVMGFNPTKYEAVSIDQRTNKPPENFLDFDFSEEEN